MNVIELGEPNWITDDKGNKIPIYDNLSMDESIEIMSHYKRLQSMVDTDAKKFKTGKNTHILDEYVYRFNVSKGNRKVKLISRYIYDGSDLDV